MRAYLAVVGLSGALLGCTESGSEDGTCGDAICGAGESNATCPADCPSTPSCGDGTCSGTETSASCPSDCGSGACTTSPDSCTGDSICVSGACVAAFPRVYEATNVMVSVPTTDPDTNQSWDVGGGAPDLYIGTETGEKISNVVADSFTATFAGPFVFTLNIPGIAMFMDVWDDDVATSDHVFECRDPSVTAADLRARTFSCNLGNGLVLQSTLQPR